LEEQHSVRLKMARTLIDRASVFLNGAEEGRKMTSAHLTQAEFERVVSEALESLPKRFADLVENVVIAVEEEPTEEDLESIEDVADGDSELLGIYRGVALTERTHDMPLMPDEIAVFRGPINRVSRTRREAVQEVRETVIHELGHYFGLDDDEMPH
jgi:predicted Zn-dependent protease with MMP-like domain